MIPTNHPSPLTPTLAAGCRQYGRSNKNGILGGAVSETHLTPRPYYTQVHPPQYLPSLSHATLIPGANTLTARVLEDTGAYEVYQKTANSVKVCFLGASATLDVATT